MSITLETDNVESVKIGTEELAKIYSGEDLVFEHDKPVWLTRVYKSYKYSLDGKTYQSLKDFDSGSTYFALGYANGKFWFGNNRQTYLSSFKTKEVAKGTYNPIANYPGLTTGANAGATNGDKVICCVSADSTDKRLHYTLDGGANWVTGPNSGTLVGTSGNDIRYIGNNRFFIRRNSADGKIYYWQSTTPNSYSAIQYELPDGTTSASRIDDVWLCNDTNNTVYVRIDNTVYYGTLQKAEGTISGITAGDDFFQYPIFVYDKYYVTANQKLYVGVNNHVFNLISGANNIYEIHKNNGQLCYRGYRNAGIVKSNNAIEKTSFTSSEAGTDILTSSTIICNRNPKL